MMMSNKWLADTLHVVAGRVCTAAGHHTVEFIMRRPAYKSNMCLSLVLFETTKETTCLASHLIGGRHARGLLFLKLEASGRQITDSTQGGLRAGRLELSR